MTLAEQSFIVLFILLIFIASLLEQKKDNETQAILLEKEILKLKEKIDTDADHIKELKKENIYLAQVLKKARGKPSCWTSPSNSIEFLFRVKIIEKDSLFVESAAPDYRSNEFKKITKNIRLGSMSQKEFAKIGQNIKELSDSKECVFFVDLHRPASIESKQIELIEKWFYKKISNLREDDLKNTEWN